MDAYRNTCDDLAFDLHSFEVVWIYNLETQPW